MPRRRALVSGRPLLVASVGIAVTTMSGCGSRNKGPLEPVGNLMAVPEPRVCVNVEPAGVTAAITVNGAVGTLPCTELPAAGPVHVVLSAPGYVTQEIDLVASVDAEPTTVALVPAAIELPTLEPVGNLMAPTPR